MEQMDVAAALNALLASKPYVQVQSTRAETRMVRPSGHYGGRQGADPPDPQPVTVYVPVTISVPATVGVTRIATVSEVKFGDVVATGLPENVRISRRVIDNGTGATFSSAITSSAAATESWSVTKTRGVMVTQGGSVTLTYGFSGVGSAAASMNFSQQVSASTAETEGGQRTLTRSLTDTINVGPHLAVRLEVIAYESPAQVSYMAQVVVDADLAPNLSGLLLASQILSVAERTFPIEGLIRVTAVSEGYVSIRDLGGSTTTTDKVSITDSMETVAGSLSEKYFRTFSTPQNLRRVDAIVQPDAVMQALLAEGDPGGGAGIGAPDGTHYEVLYTKQEFRQTPQCGFNDVGSMNTGVFSVEARRYQNYVGGALVSEWTENVETFQSCWDF